MSNSLEKSFTDLNKISENSIITLKIDRDVSEIQKSVLVYGQSGSKSVLRKLNNIKDSITNNLIKVLKETQIKENRTIIEAMIVVLNGYGDNIDSLKKTYEFRHDLIEKQLPLLKKKGVSYIESVVKKYSTSSDQRKKDLVPQILQLWLESYISFELYIKNRKYYLKKELLQKIEQMEKLNLILTHNDKSLTSDLQLLFSELKFLFNRSVQANRNFLTLVNVVMAGEALEFSSLSNQLNKLTLDNLSSISLASKKTLSRSKKVVNVSLILYLPFLFLIAFFYHLNISKAITDISKAFSFILKGDFTKPVPGLDRKDEIGQLATAADAFKKMSLNLITSRDAAEKSAKSKSEFLANMSHEIRTPLNAILGFVELLSENNHSPDDRETLEIISISGHNLMGIINDILDYSKIESGNLIIDHHMFEFDELVLSIKNIFTLMFKKKGLELNFQINKNVPHQCFGDSLRIKQILTNMISNALKFTEKGGVNIDISAKKTENKSNSKSSQKYIVNIEVKDTGMGIPSDKIGLLFGSFQQVDASTTRKFGGTGLGLAISKKLSIMMGGDIRVESVCLKSTTFFIDFIISEYDFQTTEKKEVSQIYEIQPGIKVLIAEDNKINQKLAIALLKKLNISPFVADNGRVAVELQKKHQFDLILMDVQMPILNGIDATKEIRTEKENLNKPIILALTANAFEEDKKICLASGMNDFVPKPISFKDLTKKISKHFPKFG